MDVKVIVITGSMGAGKTTVMAEASDLRTHVNEFRAIRDATLTFFRGLPPAARDRRGTASGNHLPCARSRT
jgi:hypothetical protein